MKSIILTDVSLTVAKVMKQTYGCGGQGQHANWGGERAKFHFYSEIKDLLMLLWVSELTDPGRWEEQNLHWSSGTSHRAAQRTPTWFILRLFQCFTHRRTLWQAGKWKKWVFYTQKNALTGWEMEKLGFYMQKNALTGWKMEKMSVLHTEERFDRLENAKITISELVIK